MFCRAAEDPTVATQFNLLPSALKGTGISRLWKWRLTRYSRNDLLSGENGVRDSMTFIDVVRCLKFLMKSCRRQSFDSAFVRESLQMGLATVCAGYPATSLTTGRIRFCMSASHTRAMLDKALGVVDFLGDRLAIKYSKRSTAAAKWQILLSARFNSVAQFIVLSGRFKISCLHQQVWTLTSEI